ncbi:hypothetical protein LEMLEM_LOCUS13932 [Lemmus lemmus]
MSRSAICRPGWPQTHRDLPKCWHYSGSTTEEKIRIWNRADEMTQRIKVIASKPADLSSIPGTHVVEGAL